MDEIIMNENVVEEVNEVVSKTSGTGKTALVTGAVLLATSAIGVLVKKVIVPAVKKRKAEKEEDTNRHYVKNIHDEETESEED